MGKIRPRRGHLLDPDLGESDVADLALLAEFGQRAELVLGRHPGIDAGELVQIDPVDP
jgi:hypothetical protein